MQPTRHAQLTFAQLICRLHLDTAMSMKTMTTLSMMTTMIGSDPKTKTVRNAGKHDMLDCSICSDIMQTMMCPRHDAVWCSICSDVMSRIRPPTSAAL